MRLLADENIQGLDCLAPFDIEVRRAPGREISRASLADVDALWVRSVTQVNEVLLSDSAVRFVGTATAGVEHVDTAYLQRANIAFAAAPGANANAVAEYVIAALLSQREPWQALQAGETLGIVGFGHVGRRLQAIALALGWSVCVCDPWVETRESSRFRSLDEVLSSAVVSLHCDLHQRAPWPSHHLMGERELSLLTGKQWIINACRGEVIDNAALYGHLCGPSPGNFVLDVWENEPNFDVRLLAQPALKLATPHIAGYSRDAKLGAARLLLDAMRRMELLPHTRIDGEIGLSSPDAALELKITDASVDTDFGWAMAMMDASYRINSDDRDLRQISTLSEEKRSVGFDQLRKNYPERRELRGRWLKAGQPTEALVRVAEAFGVELK